MATVPDDYELKADQNVDPVLWVDQRQVDGEALAALTSIDLSDAAMHAYLGTGKSMRLKSFGHDDLGIHFLLTRGGTTVHTDKAYTRYSHQVILRNDGNRLRGLPRYDRPEAKWHPPFLPGTLYCLDTHSPHQGTVDPRFADRGTGMKAVIAVDRDRPLGPAEVWRLFQPWIGREFTAVEFDPDRKTSPRWKDKTTA